MVARRVPRRTERVDQLRGHVQLLARARPLGRQLWQFRSRVAHLVRPVQGLQHQKPLLRAQRRQILPAAHDEGGDAHPPGPLQRRPQQLVHLQVLLTARGDVVRTGEVDRRDLGQLHEVGDVDGPGAAGGYLVEFAGLHDDVLAALHLVPLDDVLGVDVLAGALVDPLVADPVGGAALQLVEVDGVVLGRGEQPDRHGDQPEGDHPGPDRTCHDHPLRSRSVPPRRAARRTEPPLPTTLAPPAAARAPGAAGGGAPGLRGPAASGRTCPVRRSVRAVRGWARSSPHLQESLRVPGAGLPRPPPRAFPGPRGSRQCAPGRPRPAR